MHQLLAIISKLPAVLQQAIITSISVLVILLYLHTDFKESITQALQGLNHRLDGIEHAVDRHIYNTRTDTDAIKTTLLDTKQSLLTTEDRLLKETSKLEQALINRVIKLEERVFFLDRFMAKAETHIAYAREKLGYKSTQRKNKGSDGVYEDD